MINNTVVNFTAVFVLDVVCLLAVWHVATGVDKKGAWAPLDLCSKQNVLCSLNECVNNFVREENIGGKGQFGSINSAYK